MTNLKKYPIGILSPKGLSAVSFEQPLNNAKSGLYIMEIWKDIPGYTNLYLVSSYGNIKSVRRERVKGGIKKTRLQNNGYLITDLHKNNIQITRLMHRLVAQSFIPNPKKKPCINHKNGIKTDNRVENLEWVTHSENTIHGFKMGLLTPHYKPVSKHDKLTGELIEKYKSITEASKKNNVLIGSIGNNLTNLSKTAKGFVWKYI